MIFRWTSDKFTVLVLVLVFGVPVEPDVLTTLSLLSGDKVATLELGLAGDGLATGKSGLRVSSAKGEEIVVGGTNAGAVDNDGVIAERTLKMWLILLLAGAGTKWFWCWSFWRISKIKIFILKIKFWYLTLAIVVKIWIGHTLLILNNWQILVKYDYASLQL